jgi:N-methylhydantoinase A/oxoprolinase/acetone carboxylase beta subunit
MLFDFREKKKEQKDLKEILEDFKKLEKRVEELEEELKKVKEKNKFSIQKIGLVRFNPFKEMGGNQSFSLALLDENDDGIVITSLFTQETNRVYGKPVSKGKSEFLLTDEEKEAIKLAKYGKRNTQKTTGGRHFGSR